MEQNSASLDLDSRLDGGPVFYLVLHALASDVARIDATARGDVGVLTRKVAAVRAAEQLAAREASSLAARQADAERRTSMTLEQKRTAARRLHALMTGQQLHEASDAAGSAAVNDDAARIEQPAPMSPLVAVLSPPPASNRAALASFSALLGSLDARVKEASAAWKEALWAHTLADTRLRELTGARGALMDQLVAIMMQAEGEKHALRLRAWHALVHCWKLQRQQR